MWIRAKLKQLLINLFDWLSQQSQIEKYSQYRRQYDIDSTFKFNGPGTILYGQGKIQLGRRSYIGRQSSIQADTNMHVIIGSNCAISHYVKIYTTTYESDQDFIKETRFVRHGSVEIGDGVWIGANALINPGVKIGSNSIIGANAVVTSDVEPNSIVTGNPASLIRFKKGT